MVLKGLKIKFVKVKSKLEDFQKKFDIIFYEVEFKFLDVMLESLCKEVFEIEYFVDYCREDIKVIID